MARLRIATWNVCWFTRLFDRDGRLAADDAWSGMHDVPRRAQAAAITQVLRRLDADLIAVIEAPDENRRRSTVETLERFAVAAGLRARRALIGFPSHTEQEIALLFDPARIRAEHDPRGGAGTTTSLGEGPAPRFDGVLNLDLDGDGKLDLHRFSKPPLEAAVTIDGGPAVRVIAVHAKSKAPHGAMSPEEAAVISLANRHKQLAQCAWLRARIDEHLEVGDDLIVLGDFNDGPGQDRYERVFGRSGVELVAAPERPHGERLVTPYLHFPAHRPSTPRPATARFYDPIRKRYMNALLDFVMLSAGLAQRSNPRWRIWHPFDDAECFADERMKAALLAASDHFPVTVDLAPEAA